MTFLFNRVLACSFLFYLAALRQAGSKILEDHLVAARVPPEPAVPFFRDRYPERVAVRLQEVHLPLGSAEDLAVNPLQLAICRGRDLEPRPEVQPVDEHVSDEVDGQLLFADQAE